MDTRSNRLAKSGEAAMTANYADRPPRIQPKLPIDEIEVPPPPDKQTTGRQSLLEMMLPLVTIAGYVLLAVSGQGRSIMLIIPMGLAMLGSVYISLRRATEAERENEEREQAYEARLLDLRQELRNYHQLQRDFYYYNYPDPNTAISIARMDEKSRSGPRLWERRTTDVDFGMIRLGIGTRRSTVVYTINMRDNNEDPQMDKALRLAQDSLYVDQVPITLQMRATEAMEDDPQGIESQHALGIYSLSANAIYERRDSAPQAHGERHHDIYAYVRALLIHFAAFHSPLDTRVTVIGTQASKDEWEWAAQLPQARVGQNEVLLCFEGEKVKVRDDFVERLPLFLKDLNNTLMTRAQRLQDKDSGGDVTLPFHLVVVDMLGMTPDSLLSEIESEQAIATILHQGPMLGAALLFITGDASKIPSDVGGIIELETLDANTVAFRYAEVGVNTPRYVGTADLISAQNIAMAFAQTLQQYEVRASAAASLVNAIDLLQMNGVIDIDELGILQNWERTRSPKGAEWPRVLLGAKSASENRELVFEANADGVHAMVAGTTGSGKSELLQTMILGLAINYDPSVVNFVLVDFKGGGAFEPFQTLPHVVDVVTNLEGSAVERMFSAIKAELDRRGAVNAKTDVKHIVEYRKSGYHLQNNDAGYYGPYPHLFIFIDEFAEMVSENPEFKDQLDSITRLGRAIGVSLVLATQRPAGTITDQMRANIKMKICLRVETPDDSRELLRRSDAAYLPPSIPGRAYLQIGNELPEMVQVAWSGGNYRRAQKAQAQPVIWLTRPPRRQESSEQKPEKVFQALVNTMQRYTQSDPITFPRQRKPWPNPLPRYLPLGVPLDSLDVVDTEYLIKADRVRLYGEDPPAGADIYLNPTLPDWIEGRGGWPTLDWGKAHVLTANVGLMDNPRSAVQRAYTIDLKKSNAVVFGASGWGKSTFLRSLIVGLATTHSPQDLHIYILDFGNLSLGVFAELPHVGGIITADEEERINRLLRTLNNIIDERKRLMDERQADNLVAYNSIADVETLPAILVVIDNWAEIRESYEGLLPTFISLLRDGRTSGVYFAASADVPGSMGTKVFNMFTERIALRLADKSEYANIVGRGGVTISEIWGRGQVAVERAISQTPLEVQIAAPVALREQEVVYDYDAQQFRDEDNDGRDDNTGEQIPRQIDEAETVSELGKVMGDRLAELVKRMDAAWTAQPRPRTIDTLPEVVRYAELQSHDDAALPEPRPMALMGIEDRRLGPLWLDLRGNPNFIVVGPPLSGRTTLLHTWILSLVQNFTPQEVAIVMIDPMQSMHTYFGGERSLDELPHVMMSVSDGESLVAFLDRLEWEYEAPDKPADHVTPEFFVFIDNYDDFEDLMPESGPSSKEIYKRLATLVRNHRASSRLHFILAGSEDMTRKNEDFKKQVEKTRFGFALKTERAVEALGGKMPRSLRDVDLPAGRGLRVRSGQTLLAQIATPELPEHAVETDTFIAQMIEQHRPYEWYYVTNPPPEPEPEETDEADGGSNGAAPPAAALPAEVNKDDEAALRKLQEEAAITVRDDFKPPENTHPYYAMLQAEKLVRLPVALVAQLPMNFGMDPAQLPLQDPAALQARIDSGEIALPDDIPTELQAQIKQQTALVTQILYPERLVALPLEILQSLPLEIHAAGVTLESLGALDAETVRLMICNGELVFTEMVHPKVQKQIREYEKTQSES